LNNGYILSIDQGTSGTKINIFNHEGSIISSAYNDVTSYYPQPGWVEQDTNEIWQTTIQGITEAIKNARILPEDLQGIGISNQRCTTVLWNKISGEPIGKALIWLDRRTQEICNRLTPREKILMEEKTGVGIYPNCSCTKIQWLMEEDRSVQKAADRGELLFGTIDTWLIWKLSGGTAHVTDTSNASVTGMLNSQTLTYDDWILEKFGIPREILPELKSSSEIYAKTRPETFFGAEIPISGCIGDQPAAAVGQACLESGMMKNTFGTGAFMILNTGQHHFPPESGVIAPILWTVNGTTCFGLEGFADVSGEVIRWLRDGLGILHNPGDAEAYANQVTDTSGVYFVPALVGLQAPHYSPDARGTIFGINMSTNKNHITRAALESMAYQTRDCYENIKDSYGLKAKTLRVDGGGSKSDFLMQFQANILGIPVERPEVIETSSQGAAYMAGLAVGFWQSIEEIASKWKLDTCFEPRITDARRDDLYGGWLRAIDYATGWGSDVPSARRHKQTDDRLQKLSPREREVVKYFASGKSIKEIAASFYTSPKTVEKQRRDAMRKLDVHNVAGLVRICIDLGLLTNS